MSGPNDRLAEIRTFPQLIKYLRDDLDWPIEGGDFEDLTFDYTPDELGIDIRNAAKIQEIKRLRPLSLNQPWGVFFVKFEPKRLPVVALRRLLSSVVAKKRAGANPSDRAVWDTEDLLFISNYGEGEQRQISFAHFAQDPSHASLPTLNVLGWDNLDTPLHIDNVADTLASKLRWPADERDATDWRDRWRSAFTLGYREAITTSKVLAVRLAELARAIRDRIETLLTVETPQGPLSTVLKAFQESLIHDLTPDDFADMYAQTIAYGLLTARIAHRDRKRGEDLLDQLPMTNPFLKELMETFLRPGKSSAGGVDFDELGIGEVVALLERAQMDAVVRDFGDRNPQEDPVIHFYELFLKEYDAKKRIQRGVFYTPRPVVSYIVRSVDELLRTEFGLVDGLADTSTWGEMAKRDTDFKIPEGTSPDETFVQILDPATGTGTFLVEVIEVIYKTLVAKWVAQGDGLKIETLWNDYVPKHLLPRLHGYELLMAPYAIAHLKIGLKLYETGYRFGSDERAGIYLTNSLEPPHDFSGQFEFAIPALAHEAKAVNVIKRDQRFTVVVGNPPYSGLSANMSPEAQALVDAYKVADGQALNERKLWLQDDYVKFLRLGQIAVSQSGVGILAFITNHGYLTNPTFRGMRQCLMGTFGCLRVLDLHGNATKNERPPAGNEDKNVFEIKQGVAICLATRGSRELGVEHANLWGTRQEKYLWLTEHEVSSTAFVMVVPDSPHYFFAPQDSVVRAEYDRGWLVNQIMPVNSAGALTARDHFVLDFDRDVLLARIDDFASSPASDDEIRRRYFAGHGSAKYADGDTRGWKVPAARRAIRADIQWRTRTREYLYRPFDYRYAYWTSAMVDWPRPELERHLKVPGQLALCITRFNRQASTGYFFVTRTMVDFHCLDTAGDSMSVFPLRLASHANLGLDGGSSSVNLAPAFGRALSTALNAPLGADGLPGGVTFEEVAHYIYAVFHSPAYRSRYTEFLKIEFPRIPISTNLSLFRNLARCGSDLVDLHLLESGELDRLITSYTGPRDPEVERVGWSDNTVWLDAPATKKGQPASPGTVAFHGVSEDVWNFHIGGYQVCEKWLKDRKGRTLSDEDLAHYQKIVVALSETIRLMEEIDGIIEAHGGWPGAFAPATNGIPLP